LGRDASPSLARDGCAKVPLGNSHASASAQRREVGCPLRRGGAALAGGWARAGGGRCPAGGRPAPGLQRGGV